MSRFKKRTYTDPLRRVKIATAKARLAKLQAALPVPPQQDYIRYEDIPPLRPHEREALKAELIENLTLHEEKIKKEKYDGYMSMAHWAP